MSHEALVQLMLLVTSCFTVLMTFLQGKKHPSAFKIGMVTQALWSFWIFYSSNLGMLPLNVVLWVLYFRNNRLWVKDKNLSQAQTQTRVVSVHELDSDGNSKVTDVYWLGDVEHPPKPPILYSAWRNPQGHIVWYRGTQR